MALFLLGTVVLGIATASVVLVLSRWLPGVVPRWLIPGSAGAAMLLFTIWADYTWADRTIAELPDDFVVAGRFGDRSWFRPWTLVEPPTSRIRVLAGTRTNPNVPDLVMAEIVLFERYQDVAQTLQVFDCTAGERADLVPDQPFDAAGRPQGLAWVPLSADDPLLRAVCDATHVSG